MKRLRVGQTLVEMVVIIGIVVLLITGVVAGTSVSLSRTADTQLRSQAVQYAQEGLEIARNNRDLGWNAFAAMGSPATIYCVGQDQNFTATTTLCAPNIGITYTRSITLTLNNAADPTKVNMTVDVVVAWGDPNNTSNKAELISTLTPWK